MEMLLERYPKLSKCRKEITEALKLMTDTYENGGKILLCGNGGSAADCEHIVGELMKGFIKSRKVEDENIPEYLRCHLQGALPAISLPSQSALLSAYVNDAFPLMLYAQLVYGYGRENDLLIAISTSGNSENVVLASRVAKAKGMKVLSLTGEYGGELSAISDVIIKVPEKETYKVQEYHLPVYHWLCLKVEEHFFG